MTASLAQRLLALALLLGSGPAQGHDFWLEPSTLAPAAGQRVAVRIRVGEGLVGDALPRNDGAIRRFVAVSELGESPVFGLSGRDPAGLAEVRGAGAVAIGLESDGGVAAMTPESVAVYVAEEGLASQLDGHVEWRGRPLRDRFDRSAKALLNVEGGDGEGFDRLLGLPLELVPLANPWRFTEGELPFRLLAGGLPLAGITVRALSTRDPGRPVDAVTDDDGRVSLPLAAGTRWLVKAVWIRPAAAGSGADVDSTWASLVFEIPARGDGG